MAIVYKILFEVQLLHEFYLTDKDGSIFSLAAPARQSYLQQRFVLNDRNVSSDLSYSVPAAAEDLFRDHKLKLLPTYSGFRVAIAVKPVSLGGGQKGYAPLVPLPGDLNIPVLIRKKDPLINAISHQSMVHETDALPYFSNQRVSGAKTAPFLAEPVAAFNPALTYEQGSLALFAPSNIRSFYRDQADAAQWIDIPGGGYTTDRDRLLTGPVLQYFFAPASNINQATFTLKDNNSNVVRKFAVGDGSKTLQQVTLDFSEQYVYNQVRRLPSSPVGDNLFYTLEVSGSGGYNRSHRVLFFEDGQELQDAWGLVNIVPTPTDAPLGLLNGAGRIITTRNADNSVAIPVPLFEIWIKSRLSFWRYTHDGGQPLKSGVHPNFLFYNNGRLISKIPRPQTYAISVYRKPDNSLYYLPNPVLYPELRWENNRLYTDILVAESSLFPLGP